MTFLEMLGKYVQNSLTTNTFRELAKNAANIFRNRKRPRAIWCGTLSLLGGGALATIFVAQPETIAYFQPIVLKGLPFLGDVGAKIAVGVIGFWLGGAFGHNAGKFTAQEFALRAYGHSNTAYKITNAIVARIIAANPHIYGNAAERDLESNIPGGQKSELKNLLLQFRDNIARHKKEESAAHDTYKFALESALRTSNLAPIFDVLSMNEAKRNSREAYAQLIESYLTTEAARPAASRSESSSENPPMERIAVAQRTFDENVVAFEHMKRHLNGLLGRFYDLSGDTHNEGRDELSTQQKRDLLVKAQAVQDAQRRKKEEERRLVPPQFRRIGRFEH